MLLTDEVGYPRLYLASNAVVDYEGWLVLRPGTKPFGAWAPGRTWLATYMTEYRLRGYPFKHYPLSEETRQRLEARLAVPPL